MEASAVDTRLRTLERDADSTHRTASELRSKSASHDTSIAVHERQLKDQERDIADLQNAVRDINHTIVKALKEVRAETAQEMKWIRRGLWAAAATFTMIMMSFGGYVITLIASK